MLNTSVFESTPDSQPKARIRRHVRASLAVLMSLILVIMHLNLITVRISMWGMADEMLPTLFEGYLLREVQQVVGGIGEVEYTVSVGDLPNFITTFTTVVDLVEREAARSWGIPHSDVGNFLDAIDPIMGFANAANIPQIVVGILSVLLLVAIYLIASDNKKASSFVQACAAFITLLMLILAIVLNFASSALANNIGGYISMSVSAWVYTAIGLSVATFVVAILYNSRLMAKNS